MKQAHLPSRLQEQLRRGSSRVTKTLTEVFGEDLGIWYGCGYPKSGTVWLCELMSSYLYLPYPQNYLTPVLMKSVIHSHWEYSQRRGNCIYVVRDGRDVMVSYYFHWLNQLRTGRSPAYAAERRQKIERVLGAGTDLEDPAKVLPAFIDLEFREPRGSKMNWAEHVLDWTGGHPKVAVIRFDDLLADGPSTLGAALEALGAEVDRERLELVFDLHSFERRTGRAPGTADNSDFRRSGVSGEWAKYFSDEAVETFQRHAGDALVAAGFEN